MEPISEEALAILFFSAIEQKVDNNWSNTEKEMLEITSMWGKDVSINDARHAKSSFVLALVAIELQSLKNIFPDRAQNIYDKMINYIESRANLFTYRDAEKIIRLYQEKFTEYLELHKSVKEYGPFEGVAEQLIKDWFNEEAEVFNLDMHNKKTGKKIISPVATQTISLLITPYLGFWRMIKDNFIITD